MLKPQSRTKLRRVIAVMNRKGGVGKTSITSNLAGVLAEAGYRVLAVDLDQQGNLGDDLGYRSTDYNDEGKALLEALANNAPLVPVKGVRPNLDVLPSGTSTTRLADVIMGEQMRGNDPSFLLAEKLAEVAEKYDVVLLDCPPGDAALQTQALVAARWILIPTQPDMGSLQGLAQLAERVVTIQPKNPGVQPLGVVLFPMVSSATKVQQQVREQLALIMGDAAPVFTSTIRFAQAAGVDARARGQLAIELAKDAAGQDRFAWAKILKGELAAGGEGTPTTRPVAESAGSLAGDYMALTGEILKELAKNESETSGVGA
jgi:cellulose biosynthesis protein BcsQ